MKRTAVENNKDPVEACASTRKKQKANDTASLIYHFGFKLKSIEHPYRSPTTND